MKRIVGACLYSVLCAAAAIALQAQTYTTLYNFDYYTGAAWPDGGLVQASDGLLYGTTYDGEYSNQTSDGGTIFKMTTSGAPTTIENFCSANRECPAFYGPMAPLMEATDGRLYGTTFGQAPYAGLGRQPGGVFGITPAGLNSLHLFCTQSGCPDGLNPLGPLVQAFNGDLYGTTEFGGSGTYGFSAFCATGYTADGCGTVFKVTLSGEFTKLYTFCLAGGTCADGAGPNGGLVQIANGDLYGTTLGGGNNDAGTVFRIAPNGTLTTLYTFCAQSGCPDGLNPSPLVQGPDGALYGTTYLGGTSGLGTVFKITLSGMLTTVYSFCAGGGECRDGANPVTALFLVGGGLCGSTAAGGPTGQGTIFEITPGGERTTLYGAGVTTLMQDTNGDFYGTTSAGGTHGFGTVFRLSAGLPAFVKTIPTAGPVGSYVRILGDDLAQAVSVIFNGTPAASIEVISNSEIVATVPAGASSGKVQVAIPGRINLRSNVPFEVLP